MRASVEDARRYLDRLRVALASPSLRDIEEALPELARAVASMAASRKDLERKLESGQAPDAGLARDLTTLSREIGIARRLADRGVELCNGRAILLATAAGGYVASGKPAPLNLGWRIEIEG